MVSSLGTGADRTILIKTYQRDGCMLQLTISDVHYSNI